VAGGVKQVNTTGGAKTDYEIVVNSPGGTLTCSGTGLGAGLQLNGGATQSPTMTGDGTKDVTFGWTLAIAEGDMVAAGFKCTQIDRNYLTFDGYFTPKTTSTNSPTTGWEVTFKGAVYLANDRPAAVDFSDLRYQRPTSITISSLLSLVTGPSTGTLAKLPSGTVPAGTLTSPGRLLVDSDPPLNVGDFRTSRMDAQFNDSVYSPLHAVVVIGHEQQGGVGGIAELPEGSGSLPASTESSSASPPLFALFAGIEMVGLVVVAGSGWYATRRRHS
jgi:hypothetical protein